VVIFALQFEVVAGTTISGMLNYVDPTILIELTAFGLTGLGLSLALGASWIPDWPYSESLAAGIIAVALGALCFPALHEFTQPLEYPSVNGGALLFATGPPNQQLTLQVITNPLWQQVGDAQNLEDYSIYSLGNRPVHWALLLYGNARMEKSGCHRK